MKLALLVLAVLAVLAAVASAYRRPIEPMTLEYIKPGTLDYFNEVLDEIFEEDEFQASGCAGAVSHAQRHIGDRYVFGANGQNGAWDCSSFVGMVVRKGCGVNLPRTSGEICKRGSAVSVANIQAGDIICYPGHVALAISNSRLIHASNPSRGVVNDPIYSKNTITTVRRL